MVRSASSDIVIVGAGQAGTTAALSLREQGWEGVIRLIGAEEHAPYQRPPLSKTFLAGEEGNDELLLQTSDALARQEIDFLSGERVAALDRKDRVVRLGSDVAIGYAHLILATGSRARMPPIPGADLEGVMTLRSRDDSSALRARLQATDRLVVVGGGFLGLEAAATAARAGLDVTVVERLPRLLQRAISAAAADRLAEVHRAQGVEVICDVGVERFLGGSGMLAGVQLSDGSTLPTELVLVAIGGVAETSLAEETGLVVADGILVDEWLSTHDRAILAIGDCARFPNVHAEAVIRVESVQNAADQGRYVASRIARGITDPYVRTPWFWSHQFDHNLQIAGIAQPSDDALPLTSSTAEGMAIARHRGGRLVAVETIDDPRVHLRARRLLTEGLVPLERLDELSAAARRPHQMNR